jgi:hypothetical protein
MSDFRSSFSTTMYINITSDDMSSWTIVESRRRTGTLGWIKCKVFAIKKFGCNSGSVSVGSTGCRLGLEVFWNTRLNLLMTKDVT